MSSSATESESSKKVTTTETPSSGDSSKATAAVKDCSSEQNYELIDGKYYSTDEKGRKLVFDSKTQDWVEVSETDKENSEVTTDGEGRVYYAADGMYLCRDSEGNVFYLNEKNEWKSWQSEASSDKSNCPNWYFYQGDDTFYRDNATNTVYKLDKEMNEWKIHRTKAAKRPRTETEEEFDTDEEFDSDEDLGGDGVTPPGATTDPNIQYDGTTYTKTDPQDNTTYEWDVRRRAWFPKVRYFMLLYRFSIYIFLLAFLSF